MKPCNDAAPRAGRRRPAGLALAVAAAAFLAAAVPAAATERDGAAAASPAPAPTATASPAELRAMLSGAGWEFLREAARPLPPLPGPSGAVPIGNCAELLAALRAGADLEERREFPAFRAYAPCLAEAVVQGGKPVQGGFFQPQRAGRQIFEGLDLASVRSALAQRRPAEHYRLADFRWSATRFEPLALALANASFRYGVQVLALGDFRGRGQDELLVRFTEQALAGNDGQEAVLILSRRPQRDEIEATDAFDFLRGTR